MVLAVTSNSGCGPREQQRLPDENNIRISSFLLLLLLSGPVLRDTARLSQRYPPIARYGVFGVSTWPSGCDTPSPFSESFPLEGMRSGGAIIPHKKGHLSDTCAIPHENKAKGCDTPSALLSRRGIAQYGGVSRPGPLSSSVVSIMSLSEVA